MSEDGQGKQSDAWRARKERKKKIVVPLFSLAFFLFPFSLIRFSPLFGLPLVVVVPRGAALVLGLIVYWTRRR